MTEAQTLTLAGFLLARITEDENIATNYSGDRRRLAECEAKRGVVAACILMEARPENIVGSYAYEILCRLAAVYADHPEYREAWRP